MKKILLILISLISINVFGQHLSFKGIPINGTFEEFKSKLKQVGFTYYSTFDKKTSYFKGNFVGYNNCILVVSRYGVNQSVYATTVVFPENDNFYQSISDYSNLKKKLIEKYGNPSEEREEANNGVDIMNDNKYLSIWRFQEGRIVISISYVNYNFNVYLLYVDKINENKSDQLSKKDL